MRNYQWKRFPHAALRDDKGNPLLSWRVELLREMGALRLYQEFHLDEPWNSEHNKKLIPRMPLVYQGLNPKLNAAGRTTILVPVGKETIFPPDGKRIRLEDTHNDVANTIMALQVNDDSAVIWTKPDDLNIDLNKPLNGLAQPGQDFFRAVMADGKVRQFRLKIDPAKVAAMFNIASGKALEIKPEDEVPIDWERMK